MLTRFLLLLFVFSTVSLPAQPGARTTFYVAPTGKSTHPGTQARPFATPEQARNAIRKVRATHSEQACTVYFRAGDYFFTEPLDLHAQDSGQLENPIRYAGFPGEKVVFQGGRQLDPRDFGLVSDPAIVARLPDEARNKVLEMDLKQAGITHYGTLKQHGFGVVPEPAPLELFIDGERQPLARFPNEGQLPIGKVYDPGSVPRNGDFSNRGGRFGYEYERPGRWMQASDIWLYGKFSYGYNDDHLRVEKIDTAQKTFRLAQPHLYGLRSTLYADTAIALDMVGLSLRGYYAYNLLEEIDRPGEWFLDRVSGKLYLWPPEGFATAKVEISLREAPFVRLMNTAHLRLENITFSTARGMGVYLENAHHVAIEGCTFTQLGTVAVSAGQPLQNSPQRYALDGSPVLDHWTSQDFHHLTIRHCRIHRTGTGGIILTGGDRRRLLSSENLITSCEFYQVDQRNTTYAAAVKLSGVGTHLSHCYFHDLKHLAVIPMGNDHLLENCRFERICTEADDMGAISVGRDPSARGTVIRHNHFRDILPPDGDSQVGAVFLDDGVGGFEIAHNYFERTGSRGDREMFGCIALHGNHDNWIHHNVFRDCEMAIGNNYWTDEQWKNYLEKPLLQERLRTIVDITSPVYQQRYPALKNYFTDFGSRLNKVNENILINSNMVLQGKLEFNRNHLYAPGKWREALAKIGFNLDEVGIKP